MSVRRELFVELLCEELPASMVEPALSALRDGLLKLISGVEHGEVRTWATPRRLAVAISDVAEATPVVEQLVTGPPADRAFNDGEPTKVAIGFARGRGVPVESLEVVDGPRGPVVAARVTEGGTRTAEVVAGALDALVRGLPFQKSMEWGNGGVRFGRPLHAVSAIYDRTPLEGTAAALAVGNTTRGHRLADDAVFSFLDSAEWEAGLRERKVVPSIAERRGLIQQGLDSLAAELGADPIVDDELLDEVQFLVEWPVVFAGTFDEDLMGLPSKLLVTSMKVNQRYFPIFTGGELTNRFAIVSNNPYGDQALIADGNARVLRARFYDARFFLAEDRKRSLEAFADGLKKMRWIHGLGTMADKQARIAALAPALITALFAGDDLALQAGYAGRAGMLCKSDLTTQMVGEFPKLQGHMGRLYALHQGEPEGVAVGIEEHYLPAFAGDALPQSQVGIAVALADRLDTLVGCFGVGMKPKGGDPQGLRRAATGVLALLEGHGLRVELSELFRRALDVFQFTLRDSVLDREDGALAFDKWIAARGTEEQAKDAEALVADLVGFALARFKASAVAEGASADWVDAIVEVTPADAVLLRAKLAALARVASTEDFGTIMDTFKRVLNITDGKQGSLPARDSLALPEESALFDAVVAARTEVASANEALDFDAAVSAALRLEKPVAALFDAAMIEDPDPSVKARRVGLLLETAAVFRAFADFSRVSTR